MPTFLCCVLFRPTRENRSWAKMNHELSAKSGSWVSAFARLSSVGVVVSFHGYRCSASSSLLECSKSWELGFCPRSSFVCVSHVLGGRRSAAVISVSPFHGRHMCFPRFSIVTGAVHKLNPHAVLHSQSHALVLQPKKSGVVVG